MGAIEETLRQRFCRAAGCGVAFWICRCCDRGQQYCGQRCRQKARRHQQSREGRLDDRDRQRAYRKRRGLARVTDPPSQAPRHSGSITVAEPSRAENGSESGSEELGYADFTGFEPACIICGRTLRFADPFGDWG